METAVLDFFKTFADAERLRLAGLLIQETLTVDEIAARLNLRAAEVPRHLAMIEKLGLLVQDERRYRLDVKALEALSRSVLAGQRAVVQPKDENADDFDREVVKNFSLPDGRLREIPTAPKKRAAILRHIVQVFEPGVRYTEKEVNMALKLLYPDAASLRRYLYDEGLLEREPNGSAYWREKQSA